MRRCPILLGSGPVAASYPYACLPVISRTDPGDDGRLQDHRRAARSGSAARASELVSDPCPASSPGGSAHRPLLPAGRSPFFLLAPWADARHCRSYEATALDTNRRVPATGVLLLLLLLREECLHRGELLALQVLLLAVTAAHQPEGKSEHAKDAEDDDVPSGDEQIYEEEE